MAGYHIEDISHEIGTVRAIGYGLVPFGRARRPL